MSQVNLIHLFNPLKTDFETTYDLTGNRQPTMYRIPAGEIASFEPAVAEHLKKHLAREIVWSRGIKTNFEDDFKEVLSEIEVIL